MKPKNKQGEESMIKFEDERPNMTPGQQGQIP